MVDFRRWTTIVVVGALLVACGGESGSSFGEEAGASGRTGGAGGDAARSGGGGTSGARSAEGSGGRPAKNPHTIDRSAEPGNRSCYAGVEQPRACAEGFLQATACGGRTDAPLLVGELKALEDEGCYYFCPDVPNCAELTMGEAAELLCHYAAANAVSGSLALRSICGPELHTAFGPCCFGVDAITLFD